MKQRCLAHSLLRATGLALAMAGILPLAHAQSIKPGLWEQSVVMKSSSGELEKGMARMQAEMAKMSPEQRKQMEQMMGQRGIGMSPGGGQQIKLCITPEMASRLELPASDGKCTQTVTQRSGNSFKATFECAGPPTTRGQSDMTLKSDTAYSGRSVVETTVKGKPERMDMDISARWLSASCGEIKPIKR